MHKGRKTGNPVNIQDSMKRKETRDGRMKQTKN